MDFINLLGAAGWPEGNFWASLIKLFDVGSYAWTIILFTVILKLVLSPLDFLQRFYTNKTTRAQAKLQPELQKLQKRYGQNQTLLAQKQNELYQKHNVGMKGSCIVMLIYMVVTLTVFMTLYSSLGTISNYKINAQFEELQSTYHQSYDVEYEQEYLKNYLQINIDDYKAQDDKESFVKTKEEEKITEFKQSLTEEEAIAKFDAEKAEILKTAQENGQELVFNQYGEIKDSWLWVKNIWRADNPTVKQILNYNDFKGATNTKVSETEYNAVMGKLLNDPQTNSANGYYILSAIVVLVSFVSQLITRKMNQPKSKDGAVATATPGAGKIMMFVMPLIMMFFTLSSSAMFAIYIITNSLIATILTPVTTVICNKIEDKKEKENKDKNKAVYSR